MDALGKPFDASSHEILQSVPGPDHIVLEVIEDGYECHGKILRPAKVTVGSGETMSVPSPSPK